MTGKPTAAGKSSISHVDQDAAFSSIISPQAGTYLDLGCGAGNYTLALAERLGGRGVIHALDLWEEGILSLEAAAKERGFHTIRPTVADLTQPLPLDDGSVNVAFMPTVLHDLPEAARPNLLGEVQRVLVPGGVFALIEFKKLDHGPGPGLARRIGPDEADALTTPHGLTRDAVVDLGEFTWLGRYLKSRPDRLL